ncbi:MAG TPA: hypothetical protein VND22_05305 [Actinomycetota bacterium]|nr:hypothetical protein [Actinomycetota bacterium]
MNTCSGPRLARPLRIALLLVLTFLVAIPSAVSAQEGDEVTTQSDPAGATLIDCKGRAASTDSIGNPLDDVSAPGGPAASADNPFDVDLEGQVTYAGSSDSVIRNHNWQIRVFGIPVKSGGDPNERGKKDTRGTVDVSGYMPFRVSGLYLASGSISGEGGSCSGSVWLKLAGNPIGTIPWIVGLVLTLLGLYGLFASRPAYVARIGVPHVPLPPPPPVDLPASGDRSASPPTTPDEEPPRA